MLKKRLINEYCLVNIKAQKNMKNDNLFYLKIKYFLLVKHLNIILLSNNFN